VRTLSRLASILRLEDVLMALVAAVVIPAVDGSMGNAGTATGSGDPSTLTGIVGLLAVLGVIACVLTRGPGESSPLADGQLTLQGWARFPLAAGVGIVAERTIPGLGLDPGALVGIAFLATFAGALLHPKLPVVPVVARRAMVLPMVIVAAGAFNQIIGGDIGQVLVDIAGGTAPAGEAAFWPLIVAAALTMYAMLVIAPRSIADPGASGPAWMARFLFLLASVSLASFLGIG
jgi:hypothetical protein